MKKNRGFSLIELVIVVAVIGILLGILVPSINLLPGYRCREAEGKLCAALDQTRSNAMNYLVGVVHLYRDGDTGDYFVEYYTNNGKNEVVLKDRDRIADRKVSVTLGLDGGTPDVEIGSEGIWLSYRRDTGAFRPLLEKCPVIEDVEADGVNPAPSVHFWESEKYCTSVRVASGSRKRIICLYPESGHYKIENDG